MTFYEIFLIFLLFFSSTFNEIWLIVDRKNTSCLFLHLFFLLECDLHRSLQVCIVYDRNSKTSTFVQIFYPVVQNCLDCAWNEVTTWLFKWPNFWKKLHNRFKKNYPSELDPNMLQIVTYSILTTVCHSFILIVTRSLHMSADSREIYQSSLQMLWSWTCLSWFCYHTAYRGRSGTRIHRFGNLCHVLRVIKSMSIAKDKDLMHVDLFLFRNVRVDCLIACKAQGL